MDENELKNEIMTVDQRINEVSIIDNDSYGFAGSLVVELDNLKKKITAYWDEPISKAFQTHKALTAKRTEMLKPIDDRRRTLTTKISAYLTEQDRIKREAQRKLDDERRAAEQRERDRLNKMAEKARAAGKIEKAELLREKVEEVFVAPAIVVPTVEKTTRLDTGTISQKKELYIEVVSVMELLKEIVGGRLPVGIVTISNEKLKQAIKLNSLKSVPGCIIEERISASFRGK